MFSVILYGLGVAMRLTLITCATFAVLGGYGIAIGLRAVQYIGYDFSAPDND